ncbi:MAG: zinc ribbon domain-containing protein [Candidatus Moranbacteria bacterium]|nr:zinc ribbon domain-containing protein [Candidatus Moranbacteria bacterium]
MTKSEFNQIQVILGKKRPDKPHKNTFPFTGLMKCGECGKVVTAEHKYKKQKNGNKHHYIYYHCTAKNKSICSQSVVNQKEISKQMIDIVNSIKVPRDFVKWALEVIKKQNNAEVQTRISIIESQRKAYDKCSTKIDTLIEMRINGELLEEEFSNKKKDIQEEKERLNKIINNVDSKADKWMGEVEDVFNFSEMISTKFENSDDLTKKKIIRNICSNLYLKDKKVSIQLKKPFEELQVVSKFIRNESIVVRTAGNSLDKRKTALSYGQFPTMLRESDSNRRPIG